MNIKYFFYTAVRIAVIVTLLSLLYHAVTCRRPAQRRSEQPALDKLLAPNGCAVAASADPITRELRDIIGGLLADNATSTFPVAIEIRSSSIANGRAEYEGRVKRELWIELAEGVKGQFRARMKSAMPGRPASDVVLAVLVDDAEPAVVGDVIPPLSSAAPLRADTTRAQLLTRLSSANLSGVVRLSGPPSARRVETRLKQVLGISGDADVVTFEATVAGEPGKSRLTVASPMCSLSFTQAGQTWTLHRITPHITP